MGINQYQSRVQVRMEDPGNVNSLSSVAKVDDGDEHVLDYVVLVAADGDSVAVHLGPGITVLVIDKV